MLDLVDDGACCALQVFSSCRIKRVSSRSFWVVEVCTLVRVGTGLFCALMLCTVPSVEPLFILCRLVGNVRENSSTPELFCLLEDVAGDTEDCGNNGKLLRRLKPGEVMLSPATLLSCCSECLRHRSSDMPSSKKRRNSWLSCCW